MDRSVASDEHPLMADRPRLERIVRLMWRTIRKVLPWNPGPYGTRAEPRSVRGFQLTGVTADDILAEAFLKFLDYRPAKVETSWEAIAATIASRRAHDALRDAGIGPRASETRRRLKLVSADAPLAQRPDQVGMVPSLIDSIPNPSLDPEGWLLAEAALQELQALAGEVLNERNRRIFLDRHFRLKTTAELAAEHELTTQRIGQIYNDSLRQLMAHPRFPYRTDDGGGDD